MNWLLVAIASRFILGSSAVIDKLLLKKAYPNPIGYTFWLGVLGLFSLVLIPFGFHQISAQNLAVALITGCIFILAALFYFSALFRGEASSTLLLIGGLSPIFTFLLSSWILNNVLYGYEIIGFVMLILGGLLLFLVEEPSLRIKILVFGALSALFFGLSTVLTKSVFIKTNFVTGFVWIKIGAAIAVLLFLLFRSAREKILRPQEQSKFKNPLAYFLNRGYAGLGSLLVYYAVFLGSPPLIDATINLEYVFIFLGGWLVLRERFRGKVLLGKIAALILISLGIIWLGVGNYLKSTAPDPNRHITWGVTFSEKFSKMMGLDWKQNYDAIINDLGAGHLRLIAYWDIIEKQKGLFDFSGLDYQMSLAEKNGVKVILAVGGRVPRWPECHVPTWAQNQKSPKQSKLATGQAKIKNQNLLDYISAIVERYKNSEALLFWQVENEPFLAFGECPKIDAEFLDKEIALVKSLDSKRQILITDSGELSLWYGAARRGDVFGTTMYRRVHSKIFGYFDYYLPPEFFRLKEKFARFITKDYQKRYIVVELGAEPWLEHQLYETAPEDQLKAFDINYFKDTIQYAKDAGFDEYYLWGAEWWYWMKENQNHPEFWDFAKTILQQHH